nr:nuclear transport factor 2 family protein [Pseudosporangium ferrugineum]
MLDFVRGAAAAQTDRRRHHLGTVLVDRMDAGTAVVRAYLMLTSDDGPRLVATGGYTFTLVRDGDSWRIASLTLRLDSAA